MNGSVLSEIVNAGRREGLDIKHNEFRFRNVEFEVLLVFLSQSSLDG